MSREYGRSYEVYQISSYLNEVKLPPFKRDNRLCTWEEIDTTPEKIELYLPDKAIEFLTSEKTKIIKTPFLKYTLTQVPTEEGEERFIKFPSRKPKEEFKRELMFYMGMLLSSYHQDNPEDLYIIPGEYDDLLPLLLEYLYLREANREDLFSIKHLNELKKFNKTYPMFYKDYQDFEELENAARFSFMSPEKMEKFRELSSDKAYEIESLTKDSVIQLSSMEAALSLIDKTKTPSEYKELIEALMLNKSDSRETVLRERQVESYGYKRLRKEINTLKMNVKI